MQEIKLYTDLSQSKKLAEILPTESADMYYPNRTDIKYEGAIPIEFKHGNPLLSQEIAAWSLAALLNILAKIASKIDDDGSADLSSFMGQWSVNMFDCPVEATDNYDNSVDACVAMIEKLNELNLL